MGSSDLGKLKKTKNLIQESVKKQDAQVKQAAAASAADPNNQSNYAKGYAGYVSQFGDNAGTKDAFYSDTMQNAYKDNLSQLGQFTTPISGVNIDPAFRNYQMQLAQQLQNQAMGQGPSLAQMQLQQATDRTLNQSLGAIKSGLGGQNAALAARTAALASSQQLAGMGQQSGMLRLQEQQQAQAALANLANQGRVMDSGDAQQQFGQSITARQQALNALDQQADTIGSSMSGFDNIQRSRLGMQAADQQAKQADKAAKRASNNAILGSLITIGATAAGTAAGGPAGGAAAGAAANTANSEKQKTGGWI